MQVLVTMSSRVHLAKNIKGMFGSSVHCKFVACKIDGDHILSLTPTIGGRQHIEIARELEEQGCKVWGGGKLFISPPTIPQMFWGSQTMLDVLGFDRPDDETLLGRLKEQLERDLAGS